MSQVNPHLPWYIPSSIWQTFHLIFPPPLHTHQYPCSYIPAKNNQMSYPLFRRTMNIVVLPTSLTSIDWLWLSHLYKCLSLSGWPIWFWYWQCTYKLLPSLSSLLLYAATFQQAFNNMTGSSVRLEAWNPVRACTSYSIKENLSQHAIIARFPGGDTRGRCCDDFGQGRT